MAYRTVPCLWRTIQVMWNYENIGPPDHITVDQGTNYISKEMRTELDAVGVILKKAPIENPGNIGTV